MGEDIETLKKQSIELHNKLKKLLAKKRENNSDEKLNKEFNELRRRVVSLDMVIKFYETSDKENDYDRYQTNKRR